MLPAVRFAGVDTSIICESTVQFNSLAYFGFLVVAIATTMKLSFRLQNLWLVLLSYGFYAFWDWRFCSLMLLATLLAYYPGIKIGKALQEDNHALAKKWLTFSITFSLVLLGVFKYTNFFIDSAVHLLEKVGVHTGTTTLNILLPAGISFYLFHTISYVVDVYRKEVDASKDFVEVALFLSFFPQLIAGPIARSSSLLPQCQSPRVVTPELIHQGLLLILIGLFRKVAIADTAGALADECFIATDQKSFLTLAQGVLWYSIQIYSDFAGYSDMAIGSASLFGFKLVRNFDHPYLSSNISEFWQRWHISLSSWLRDYLYIPLGGNRKGKVRTYVNLSLTMLLGGLWHGASWNFVIWGALHGLYLVIFQLYRGLPFKLPNSKVTTILGTGAVLTIVGLTWIPFRSPDINTTFQYFKGLANVSLSGSLYVIPSLILVAFVILIDLPQRLGKSDVAVLSWNSLQRAMYIAILICLIILSGDLSGASFIYFQF